MPAENPEPKPGVPVEGRRRVVIERVSPEIDCGEFAIKRVAGDTVTVEAAVFADGHDQVACRIVYWLEGGEPQSSPMRPLTNDRWRGEFSVEQVGRYQYTIEGWIDRFATWRSGIEKKIAAGQEVHVDLLIGADLVADAAQRAKGDDAASLRDWAKRFREQGESWSAAQALDDDLLRAMERHPDLRLANRYEKELTVVVDREKAAFSAWYEVFPRSCSPQAGRHGTFRDCEGWLAYITSMGFDVVYLPPVHPIGNAFRKGKNNSVVAQPGDVGSPWAIGSAEGGHKSVLPELGTLADFRHFVSKAKEHGLEVALDIAFQGTADHPWVKEHREWFRERPDGTIQYAENPPKKYQDIYPLDFETAGWRALWEELKSVFEFWIEQGVHIFRVDNPHTKPFAFWKWLIGELKGAYPEVLLLAEAFTRPHVMYRLAKLGFSQSYTYFTWRNTKQELTEYFTELTQTEVREYFRPNLWPNTPDILHEYLQVGGRPAFMVRFVLAATLGSSYGIYGPAFELCENVPAQAGSEEYLNSEKYELKDRDLGSPTSLRSLISKVNAIRRGNSALHRDRNLRFHDVDNPALICYSKATDDLSNVVLTVVNLDCFNVQTGWVNLDLAALGVDGEHAFQVEDMLGDARYLWKGSRNYVALMPGSLPAHILRVRRWVRTEQGVDYFS
ncbi:MAG TPA: alpha-1,4-glucan--maltose-1-phosphate maltosyltransferase [Candidatus Acidoferrum sp.]|nr:alpha-1,4-glucan--maltose-1-phosphate maltosyltransferase [Candidatus Acidoferrum sp.]